MNVCVVLLFLMCTSLPYTLFFINFFHFELFFLYVVVVVVHSVVRSVFFRHALCFLSFNDGGKLYGMGKQYEYFEFEFESIQISN